MLSEALPINPLPANVATQLYLVGDFYVCTRFTKDVVGPPIARIGENVYYRFMNFINR